MKILRYLINLACIGLCGCSGFSIERYYAVRSVNHIMPDGSKAVELETPIRPHSKYITVTNSCYDAQMGVENYAEDFVTMGPFWFAIIPVYPIDWLFSLPEKPITEQDIKVFLRFHAIRTNATVDLSFSRAYLAGQNIPLEPTTLIRSGQNGPMVQSISTSTDSPARTFTLVFSNEEHVVNAVLLDIQVYTQGDELRSREQVLFTPDTSWKFSFAP